MAMNVNDVICVGARPILLVDYLAVHTLDDRRTDEILRGLGAAAKEAGVAIPGGELAQLPEIVGSDGNIDGDPTAFDLAGTCVGTMRPDEIVLGDAVQPGDIIIGIASSGIHSNGLTLARGVLLKSGLYRLNDEPPGLGRSLGEELLEPTQIYVRAATALFDAGLRPAGMVHVTGDGLTNLCRLEARVGYRIDALPERQPIFELIQRAGGVSDAEMFRVFNMGVGFVVVSKEAHADQSVETIAGAGYQATVLGEVVPSSKRMVSIESLGLMGSLEEGDSFFTAR
jgi:phosphoribosylformylglycinamidine cyclo-ligase